MADETPGQIREKVKAEELAKGSDPRVAEGRAKAAEWRAKEGLPIDPDQAWRAKLAREGGEAPAAPAAPAAVAVAEPPEAEAPAEAAVEAEEAPAAPEPTPAPAPAAEAPPAAAPAPARAAVAVHAAPAPVPVMAPPTAPPEAEPEVGEVIEFPAEGLEEIAGVKLRETTIPVWLVAVLLVIAAWAVFYLMAFSGAGAAARGCSLGADNTFICFEVPEGAAGQEAAE